MTSPAKDGERTMTKDDGGQAFPHGDPTHGGDFGMTLRDYFAAHAPPMEDWWAKLQKGRDLGHARVDELFQMRSPIRLMADWAQEYATEMLAAREGPNDG